MVWIGFQLFVWFNNYFKKFFHSFEYHLNLLGEYNFFGWIFEVIIFIIKKK